MDKISVLVRDEVMHLSCDHPCRRRCHHGGVEYLTLNEIRNYDLQYAEIFHPIYEWSTFVFADMVEVKVLVLRAHVDGFRKYIEDRPGVVILDK